MDFIKVTLMEKLDTGISISTRQSQPDYLLPITGIKSVRKKILSESGNSYMIEIIESFKPNDVEFNVDYAEADLPKDFIRIIN
jgi:hypothetical protein